ncbi:hypothetical protein KC573_00740 [candidate division WWE3 bacterium]|uniref:DUF5666 domain-containing protein n=1 Tax=candidate division WWE3 bacterium TaxID=2053526 RepID=A0A955RWZ8_UNCKA|nr:hypothetical protein [candidate division WWE3 bacterium]
MAQSPSPTEPIQEVQILKEYAKIIKKDGSLIIISAEDSVYELATTHNTIIENEDGKSLSLSDIKSGDTITIVFTQSNVAISIIQLDTSSSDTTEGSGFIGVIDTISNWMIGIVFIFALLGGIGLLLVRTGGLTKIKNRIATSPTDKEDTN